MHTNGQSPLELRVARAEGHLHDRRRRLVQAILENAEEACFLSSRELARRHAVDPATIVRTAQALGYRRFGDFSADLRQHFLGGLTPYAVMKAAASQPLDLPGRVRQSLHEDFERVRTLQTSLGPQRVIALARQIQHARRVVIVGVDLAASLSGFLAYSLRALGFDAEAPGGSAGDLLHHVRFLTGKDLLIAISFRKCLRETVESVRRARTRGVPTFGITDSAEGPLGRYCDRYLAVSIESSSFTGSYVAAMAALNAVIVACAHQSPKRSLAALQNTRDEYTTGPRWFQEQPASRLGGDRRARKPSALRRRD